jgi:hypothetical protein
MTRKRQYANGAVDPVYPDNPFLGGPMVVGIGVDEPL